MDLYDSNINTNTGKVLRAQLGAPTSGKSEYYPLAVTFHEGVYAVPNTTNGQVFVYYEQ